MTKLLMTCGAAILLAACASQPATTGSTASPSVAPAAGTTAAVAAATSTPAKGKLICEDSEQIGSHFHSRVCLTPEQGEARKKAARDMMLNSQSGMCASKDCAGGGGGGGMLQR